MTREQEDKIIAQAQDILERRMAVETELKIDLHKLVYYGAYYLGALQGARSITDNIINYNPKPKGEDWIYIKAEWDLITASKRNMQLWLDDTQIGFRNHVRNAKNKLEWCECYFLEHKQITQEVK